MAEAVARVALLARAGNARDQLHRALTDLGAVLVAEGDPAELDPQQVISQSPTLVVVSLEPAVEAALDRFEALLALPDVQVMYDDAEVTRQLDGWDLNRWARHLAAKLLGRDTLPPAPDDAGAVPDADLSPVPGAPPTPAQLMDGARLEEYTQDAPELAEWVPTEPSLTAAADPAPAEAAADNAGVEDFHYDLGDVESSLHAIDEPAAGSAAPVMNLPSHDDDLTLDNDFSLDVDLSHLEADTAAPAADVGGLSLEDDSSTLADFEPAAGTVRFSKFGDETAPEELGDLDADVAALAAQLDAFEQTDTREAPRDPDFAIALDQPPVNEEPSAAGRGSTGAGAGAGAGTKFDFGKLELAGEDTLPPPGPPPPPKPGTSKLLDSVSLTLAPLESEDPPATKPAAAPKPAPREEAPKINFGGLSLESMDAPSAPTMVMSAVKASPGAVLVLAGMGGPDAVRQLLLNLPDNLPVPVLLYQHLEVGKHERLAEQLAKISRLPVALAAEGASADAGRVSVLPAGMSAVADGGALRFAPGPLSALLHALPAAESVVVMLSGADAALVPTAMGLQAAGATVLAQDPENCFDPAAAQAVKAQGGAAYPAAELADRVAKRWQA